MPDPLPNPGAELPGRPFRLIAFDWDGTAVANRREDAGPVRGPIERLLQAGVLVAIVTGTSYANLDRQLASGIRGEHKRRLFLATNRGSEVYSYDRRSRPVALFRRTATAQEERALTDVAEEVRRELVSRTGLSIAIVYDRLNRRKIDLIPLPEWSDPPKSEMPALLRAVEGRLTGAGLTGGLREAFRLAEEIVARRFAGARVTSDVKHLEVGLTDKGDAVRWLFERLVGRRGVTVRDVLVGGDEFGPVGGLPGSDGRMLVPEARGAVFASVGPEPGGVPEGVLHLGGGPPRFRELLEQQASLHPVRLAAARTRNPGWLLVESGFDLSREHEVESLFALSNGALGTRASLAEGSPVSAPGTYAAGIFENPGSAQGVPGLALLWNWAELHGTFEGATLVPDRGEILHQERTLDLAQGILWRSWRHRHATGRVTRIEGLRLASLADRHLLFQSVTFSPENYSGLLRFHWALPPGAALAGAIVEAQQRCGDAVVAYAVATQITTQSGAPVEVRLETTPAGAVEGCHLRAEMGKSYRFDRLVCIVTSRETERPAEAARARLEERLDEGTTAAVAAHRRAWRKRWRAAAVEPGDVGARRALRFAAYHLVSAANPEDPGVSIGARGLTGPAYMGHVFWDTEVYMLPFYALTAPDAARALLEYRHRTLPAALARAASLGYRGALYAWESALSGEDVTPPFVIAPDGTVLPVVAGQQEHHISADVAYGVWSYWRATGDDGFLLRAGAEILVETARFWASRVERGADGLVHVRKVMGPDEYHPSVDDDAYTNGMARCNLEWGARVVSLLAERWPAAWADLRRRLALAPEEPLEWASLASDLYSGLDPRTGVLEQFRGYFDLEEVPTAAPPGALRWATLVDPARAERTKVIKQASVVLLLHLLWDRFEPRVREASFRYYEPRTAHGSSLSPPIHAAVAARLGDLELAQRYFRQTAEIDLADNMGNAAGGVHLAALGGLWQAAIFGFAGLDLGAERPRLAPRLPPSWGTLRFAISWRGQRIGFEVPGTPPRSAAIAAAEASP